MTDLDRVLERLREAAMELAGAYAPVVSLGDAERILRESWPQPATGELEIDALAALRSTVLDALVVSAGKKAEAIVDAVCNAMRAEMSTYDATHAGVVNGYLDRIADLKAEVTKLRDKLYGEETDHVALMEAEVARLRDALTAILSRRSEGSFAKALDDAAALLEEGV